MVRDIFKDTPCLPGLFLAALFSASLSTMSSVLSGMSAMLWEDIVKPHCKPMSEKRAIRITQLSVLGFGGLAIAIAFGISGTEGPVSRGGLAGGVVCVLFVGWVSFGKLVSKGTRVHSKLEPASTESCPGLNSTTADLYISAGAIGNNSTYIMTTTHSPVISGPQGLGILYSLSYKWLAPLGICLVLIVGTLVSRLQAHEPVCPRFVVPVCDHLCCCIPQSIRRRFRCGIRYPEINGDGGEGPLLEQFAIEVLSATENT